MLTGKPREALGTGGSRDWQHGEGRDGAHALLTGPLLRARTPNCQNHQPLLQVRKLKLRKW